MLVKPSPKTSFLLLCTSKHHLAKHLMHKTGWVPYGVGDCKASEAFLGNISEGSFEHIVMVVEQQCQNTHSEFCKWQRKKIVNLGQGDPVSFPPKSHPIPLSGRF